MSKVFPIVLALHGHLQRYGVTAVLQDGVIRCSRGSVVLERNIHSILDDLADLTPDADASARVIGAAVLQEMGIENELLQERLAHAGARP